jgi:hypothetical protein
MACDRAAFYNKQSNCDATFKVNPTRAFYTGSSMQIPGYVGWPITIVFGVGILFMVAA